MRFIAITNFIANFIYVIGIVVLIWSNLDFKYIALLRSLGLIIASLVSFLCAIQFFKVKFIFFRRDIVFYLSEGSLVFISTIASNIFQNTPVLLIKVLFSYEIVGVYSSIEKLISFGKQIVMIINQVLHPRLAVYYVTRRHDFINIWKKSSLVSLVTGVSIVLLLIGTKTLIFNYFSELKQFTFTSTIYYLMTFLIITYTVLNSLGLNGLLVINKTRYLALSQIYPLVLYIIISVILITIKMNNVLAVVFLLLIIDLLIITIRSFMFKSCINHILENK